MQLKIVFVKVLDSFAVQFLCSDLLHQYSECRSNPHDTLLSDTGTHIDHCEDARFIFAQTRAVFYIIPH